MFLTFRQGGLIDHRAPGAGQHVDVKPDGKFISRVGLQIAHQNVLLIPADKGFNHSTLDILTSRALGEKNKLNQFWISKSV